VIGQHHFSVRGCFFGNVELAHKLLKLTGYT
jgi:hypothetical protein